MTAWCTPFGQLAWVKMADEKLARKIYDTASSFSVGNNRFFDWKTTPLPLFKSYYDYAHAGAAMQGGWVCYDNEKWPGTPAMEQQHPKAFMAAFAALADARGQKLVAAPSRDLIYVQGCDDPWAWPEKINDGYLRCGIPAAAKGADVFICQAQGSQKNLDEYAALLAGARNQIPSGMQLWSELTTNLATADQMFMAYKEVPVEGFWLNILSQDQVPIAVDFFRKVAASL